MSADPSDSDARTEPDLGWKAVAIAAAFYTLCVSVATWPRVLWFRSTLPSLLDPLQHLWIMRWYKACLFQGQSLVLSPDIQYPTGAPLGSFSPLHFQTLLYIPLSLVIPNDVLCYNLIWMFGIVSTGLGTFLLVWRVVGDRWCAGFGGMLAMLSTPMLLHATAHLELIFLGSFPFFLWTWMRFLDQPGRKRLLAAVGAFVLVALCAAYFAVYAVFPAALYYFWKGASAGPRGRTAWFRDRRRWLLAFSALVLPCLLIDFGNQIWAMAQGYIIGRPYAEYRIFSAPLWSYGCPTPAHALGRMFPSSWYISTGMMAKLGECSSYLGVVSILLVAYAAAIHVRFREMSYWWACLVLMVVLAGGTAWTIVGYHVPLPGYWLKRYFPLFQMIRVPSRFNLYAAVAAAVVASCGLRHLLAHLPWRWLRGTVLIALTVGAVADLAIVPYPQAEIPPPPGCYAFMERTAPGTAFVEVPQARSTGSDLSSINTYWQSIHGGRTSAGYCGQGNAVFDNLVTYGSPFFAESVDRPGFLEDSETIPILLLGDVPFHDYVWLYLKTLDFRFVVVHQDPRFVVSTAGLQRLKSALAASKIYEDATSIVYDRERLTLPTRPVMMTTAGWRLAKEQSALRVANREARLTVFNPHPDCELHLTFDAKSLHRTRVVRLVGEGRDLGRWEVRAGSFQHHAVPPFRLSAGLHELILASDGESRPKTATEAALRWDAAPFSLKVNRLQLESSATLARGVRVDGKTR